MHLKTFLAPKVIIYILGSILYLSFGLCISSAQDSLINAVEKNKTELPSKESIFDDDANYQNNPIRDYNDAYYNVNRLNEQIGLSPSKFNLQTPQATLEHYIISCRNEDFEDAIYALNFNLMSKNMTKEDATELTKKLFFVINQRVNIDWDLLSDRPDGQTDISTTTNNAIAGAARRSVVFGEIDLDGRDIVLRLQRVRIKDYGAFWLISANTVDNIEQMYAAYGPRKLDLMMPQWARFGIFGVPIWKVVGMLLLGVLAFYLGKVCLFCVRRLCRNSKSFWIKNLSRKLAKPIAFTIATIFFYVTLNKLISFSGSFATVIYTILLITVVAVVTWLIMQFIDYLMINVAERNVGDISDEENKEARKLLTYISVARRLITFLVIIIGGYIILSQFRSLEKLGISLLASAGVATVIIGIAAQSTLGNIIAGLQIAFTKPVRVGDTVIIEDDWGYVEDIKFTFMVVRTWDLRRLVVPLKYVVSNTFENWSMTDSKQIRPIYLYADYKVDVDKVRQKFLSLLSERDEWEDDGSAKLQVYEMTEKSVKMRALCNAKDASTVWDLHCDLREAMIKYIAELENGTYLSQSRVANANSNISRTDDDILN